MNAESSQIAIGFDYTDRVVEHPQQQTEYRHHLAATKSRILWTINTLEDAENERRRG